MASEKILSICIPTYNRAKALNRLLENLALEAKGLSERLEICVSDNGSSDDTPKILDKWEKRLPLVRRSNEKNLGYDINALEVTKMGNGKYLWYVGDDDLVVEGSVKRLVEDLASLGKKEVGVVYLNARLRERWVVRFGFKDFKVFPKDGIPAPLNVSFGGSICFNKDVVRKIIEKEISIKDGKIWKANFNAVAFNDFVHSYLFMECLERSADIGIEPHAGIRILADGNRISYRKKLYLELIIVKYVLEMKERYPWFKEAELIVNSKMRVIGRTFINSGFALEDSGLEYLFQAYLKVVMRILELENRKFEMTVLKIFSTLRMIPVLRQLYWLKFAVLKFLLRMPFDNRKEENKILDGSIKFALEDAERLLG